MNGVIEWIVDGKATGKFCPYIKIGRNPIQMILENGKPQKYNTRKEAKQAAKDMEACAKIEPKN